MDRIQLDLKWIGTNMSEFKYFQNMLVSPLEFETIINYTMRMELDFDSYSANASACEMCVDVSMIKLLNRYIHINLT